MKPNISPIDDVGAEAPKEEFMILEILVHDATHSAEADGPFSTPEEAQAYLDATYDDQGSFFHKVAKVADYDPDEIVLRAPAAPGLGLSD